MEIPGVNVVGHFSGASGLGQAARSTVSAMAAAGVPHQVVNVIASEAHDQSDGGFLAGEMNSDFPVNLVHLNPDALVKVVDRVGISSLKGRYNIGYWLWETESLPPAWYPAFGGFDEIWTASTFCLDAISRVSPVPVVRVPLCVEPAAPAAGRRELGLPEGEFTFLFVFDAHSSVARKNPVAVIEAYKRAFAPEAGTRLVIKSANAPTESDVSMRMTESRGSRTDIQLIDRLLRRSDAAGLINACDCYVSLHRAEGFGLTIAEAMYFGKPVIATGWSANMDIMDEMSSLPVRYDLTPVAETSDYHLYTDGVWAEPDIEHAAERMRWVFENREAANAIGKRASASVRKISAPGAVGSIIRARLERIGEFTAAGRRPQEPDVTHLVEELRSELHNIRGQLTNMKQSRFWRLRDRWFAVKRALGLTEEL